MSTLVVLFAEVPLTLLYPPPPPPVVLPATGPPPMVTVVHSNDNDGGDVMVGAGHQNVRQGVKAGWVKLYMSCIVTSTFSS